MTTLPTHPARFSPPAPARSTALRRLSFAHSRSEYSDAGSGGDGQPIDVLCMACTGPDCDFKPTKMQRRAVGPNDILIDMKYCGVCHSDLHYAAGHVPAVAMDPNYQPGCVPGHELAGVCVAVGASVTKVKVGEKIGVGCMVDSCQNCGQCRKGEEQMCPKQVGTYGGKNNGRHDKRPEAPGPTGVTLGGYTDQMVVDENFAIIIPDAYPLEAAGPVMCAGITMYDPLVKLGAGPQTTVGIAGLGGLGVMGAKIAKALGCSVTVISRNMAKEGLAKSVGADNYLALDNPAAMEQAKGSLDIILNSIPIYHDYDVYTRLLSPKGKQVILGLHKGIVGAMVAGKATCGISKVMGSGIGGIKATQAVIDLCARHNIVPELKVVPVTKLNEVYIALDKGNDDGSRYVLDIANTLNEQTPLACDGPAPSPADPDGKIGCCGGLQQIIRLICCCKCR